MKKHSESKDNLQAVTSRNAKSLRFEERELVASSVDNDEGALSKAKVSWLFGEWNDLVEMDQVILVEHPVREKLALLKASAHQQLGNHDKARTFTRMALDWGCSPRIVAQIMIAGVHNTLGRIAALKQDEERISNHFFKAVDVIVQGGRTELVSHARAVREMTKMGLLPQVAGLVDKELKATASQSQRPDGQKAKMHVLQAELDLLHHELSLVQQRQQILHSQPGELSEQRRSCEVTTEDKDGQGTPNGDTSSLCDEDVSAQNQEQPNLTFSPEAYAFYQGVSDACLEGNKPPFILIDSKSLPRSGLHYMKNTFAKLLQDAFSFCEWYQEPGCCKKIPCALTAYAEQSLKSGLAKLRLVKSHDFDCTDPVFLPLFSIRRLILVRNPLFMLTSWFALEQMTHCQGSLEKAGIHIEKIWLSHEPEVLEAAYGIINETFRPPDESTLGIWLEEKGKYITGFIEKWVLPAIENPQPFLQLVRYEEINPFIIAMLMELRDYLPKEAKERIDTFVKTGNSQFHARQNPFHAPSERISIYLAENEGLFTGVANKILSSAPLGTFGNDSCF